MDIVILILVIFNSVALAHILKWIYEPEDVDEKIEENDK